MATARFLERLVAQRPTCRAAGRRLVDVDLRRGRVRVPRARPRRAGARGPRSSSLARDWECRCPRCGAELRPVADARDQAADPDLGLRDHQARSRGAVPGRRRRLRHPDRRAALLQRLRPGAGALEPVHGRRGDLRVAPAQRPRARHLRGRRAVARLHPRLATSSQGILLALESEAASATRSTSAPAGRRRRRGRPGARARARRRHRARACAGSTAPATSATASPTRTRATSSSGFEAGVTFEDGMARADRRGCEEQEADDRVDQATRGARRARPRAVNAVSTRHDLAIIIVSTNEARWLRRCLTHGLRACGRCDARCRRRRQRVHRRHPRARGDASFPDARVVTLREPRLRPREQPGLRRPATRAMSSSSTRTPSPRGHVRAIWSRRWTPGPTSASPASGRSPPTGSCCRRSAAFRRVSRALGEALGSERWPVRPPGLGERELDLAGYERGARMRLDLGLVHARPARGAPERGLLDERFFIYSEETDLCLRIKQAGWEIRHLPDDDHPPRGQGRLEPAGGGAERLRQTTVHAEAFHLPLAVSPLLPPSPSATACALLHGSRNLSKGNVHTPPSARFSVVGRLRTGSHRASRLVLNSAARLIESRVVAPEAATKARPHGGSTRDRLPVLLARLGRRPRVRRRCAAQSGRYTGNVWIAPVRPQAAAIVRLRPRRRSPRRPDLRAGARAPHHARAPARTSRRRYLRHRGGRDAYVSRNGDDVRPIPLLRPARGDRVSCFGGGSRLPGMEGHAVISRDVLASYAADAALQVDGVRELVDGQRRHRCVRVRTRTARACSSLLGDDADWAGEVAAPCCNRGVPRPRGRCGGGVPFIYPRGESVKEAVPRPPNRVPRRLPRGVRLPGPFAESDTSRKGGAPAGCASSGRRSRRRRRRPCRGRDGESRSAAATPPIAFSDRPRAPSSAVPMLSCREREQRRTDPKPRSPWQALRRLATRKIECSRCRKFLEISSRE